MAILLVSVLKRKISKMRKIDISQWQEYKISQLFSVRPSKYVRENGKVVSNRKLLDDGPNPVVVNSSVNNGIGGTTSYEPTEHGNVITYSDTVDGNTIFYQAKPFVGYSHVKVMEPKEKRNPVEMIFLTAVIGRRLSDGNYDYTNKMTTNRVLNTTIKLPTLSDGSPDWQYMDEYIAKLATQAHTSISLLRQQQKKAPTVNIDRWKEFKLTELFNVKTGAYLSKNQLKPGSIPRVTVSSVNNGIVGPFERCGLSNERLFSNFLSVNFFGNVFYHDSLCSVDMKVHVLEPKHLYSKESMLFLVAVLRRKFVIEGYGTYGNQLSSSKLKMDMVYLPVDASGSPDWQYMDNYISSIQQAQKKRVARLTSIVKK